MPPSPTTSQENYNKMFAFQSARERSMSLTGVEEQDSQNKGKQRLSTNSSRYKTELCRPYEENGICKYGDKCQFAHGIHEIRSLNRHPKYKTELCRTFHTIGFCPYGPRCHFVHKAEELERPTSDARSESVSSLGSTPPSPTPSIENLQSPFVNIPTPTTPGLHGDVFVFGEESSTSISPPLSSSGNSSGSSSPVHSPFPIASPLPEGFPAKIPLSKPASPRGKIIISEATSPMPIPASVSPSDSGESSSVDSDVSPSSEDGDMDPFGPRRLPIFNKLA